ncbi:MAG: HIT family protein [archaeon]|jgi:histidine triad (HIT) family protein
MIEEENCIFCKFAKGIINPIKIYEDELCFVFMDKFPLTKGQTLVVGKKHVDYVFDLEDELYQHLFKVSKKIVKATDKALSTERCWLIVQGMQVPHNHIKILPVYKEIHINIEEGSGNEASDQDLQEIANKIKKELEKNL